MALISLIYFIYHLVLFYKNKKVILKNLLKNITLLELNDSKKFAYEWTKYTNKIHDEFKELKIKKYLDTLDEMKSFSNSLYLYKYKSKSDALDNDTISKFSKLKEKILAISI
jgi:hypothetical protein